jgi:two-component system NtrC family sensor kinase
VVDYAEGLPNILGDFSQLQQVVINLLLNAIQAVDKQGTIQIKLHAEGAKGSECFVHLHIWDNGVGIPAEDLDKVFDPFYSTKSGKKEGVGLGLSIAKQIIDAHRGRITIQSDVGKGTNVKVRLPT